MSTTAKDLDQFYTREDVARELTGVVYELIPEIYGTSAERLFYLEPSAGTGSFLTAMAYHGLEGKGYDIDPSSDGIDTADFLVDDLEVPDRDQVVVIGNPPFGKRAKTALEFLERSFTYSDTVAFIMPVQLSRYLTQKNIREQARLVYSETLDPNIFVYQDKGYSVRCVFQVWTLKDTDHDDLRVRTAPPTRHPDFESAIYNCTESAEKFFHQQWDFAILRQGWGPFVPVIVDDYTTLSYRKQWMFFRSDDPEVIDRLKSLDYTALSEGNTSVRGFGKADVVSEYNRVLALGS